MWHSPIVKAIWLYKCKNQHAIRNPSIKGEKQSAADETVDIFLWTYSKRYSFRFNFFCLQNINDCLININFFNHLDTRLFIQTRDQMT